jgi:hypothetical protein
VKSLNLKIELDLDLDLDLGFSKWIWNFVIWDLKFCIRDFFWILIIYIFLKKYTLFWTVWAQTVRNYFQTVWKTVHNRL